jgi:hypothetical protein
VRSLTAPLSTAASRPRRARRARLQLGGRHPATTTTASRPAALGERGYNSAVADPPLPPRRVPAVVGGCNSAVAGRASRHRCVAFQPRSASVATSEDLLARHVTVN